MKRWNMVLLGLITLTGTVRAANVVMPPEETAVQRDARMAWWREAKFGLFIHWGLYSVPAGTYAGQQIPSIGEWIMNHGKIPVARYAEYAKEFNPVKFNAAEWVKIAKGAGMKYIVITAKHHDGFAMFRSKVSPFNIYDATPFKCDALAALAVACRKAGLKLGFYYSQAQDWHHPGGAAHGKGVSGGATQAAHWDKAQDGDLDKYIDELAVPQVRELLANYGEFPAILWWDTPKDMTPEKAARLFKVVQELRPQLITNNRLGGGFAGDTETPEQYIPAGGFKDRDFETCMTMNDTWGFKSYDNNWKSTETLINNLCDIASKGGNYLLNVGPTSAGLIPAASVERLAQVGDWMRVNGEAIYGSHASAFGYELGQPEPQPEKTKGKKKGRPKTIGALDWRCTTKPGKLYFCLLKWPGEKFEVKEMKGKATKAYLLADSDRKPLAFAQAGDKLSVPLPATAPGQFANVLCVELAK